MARENIYKNLLCFSNLLNKNIYEYSFEENVLQLMHDLFNFEYTGFIIYDREKDYVSKFISNTLDTSFLNSYVNSYASLDPVNKYVLNADKKVVTINDVTTYDEFYNSNYYLDLLGKYGYNYLATMIFNKNTDGIAVLKKNNDFLEDEMFILEQLSEIISNAYNKFLSNLKIKEQNSILKNLFDNSPYGIVVSNYELKPIYINENALAMIKKFLDTNDNTYALDYCLNIFKNMKENMYNSISKIIGYYMLIANINVSNYFNNHYFLLNIIDIRKGAKYYFSEISHKYNLTAREKEIITLVAKGLSNKEIAQKLFISNNSVKCHIENIFAKLNVKNRSEAIFKITPFCLSYEN